MNHPERKSKADQKHQTKLLNIFFECEENIFKLQTIADASEDDELKKLSDEVLLHLDPVYDHICRNKRAR